MEDATRSLADEREEVYQRLAQTREEARRHEVEARKVPHLEAEIERLRGQVATQGDKLEKAVAENDSQLTRIAKLRFDINVLKDELEEANAVASKIEEAEEAASAAREQAEYAEQIISSLNAEKANLQAEVERLQPHEAQTALFLRAVEKAKELS